MHNAWWIIYALIWMHTKYTKYTLGLVGFHFPWKSLPISSTNLLMQNTLYIVKYVNCIMHKICTHRIYTKQMNIMPCGVSFKRKESTNFINEIYSAIFQYVCMMHKICIMHIIYIMHNICIKHNIFIMHVLIWMLQKKLFIGPWECLSIPTWSQLTSILLTVIWSFFNVH